MGIPNIAGALGTADQHPGVIGTSNALMGVYGFSTNNAGVVGETANPKSFAGYFAGNVIVTGTLNAGVKNAIVPFPDGSKRVLHCMESPEHWFEDFGSARLTRGKATVKLDADFAKVVKLNDYRVFLTPEGDCHGLYVRRKTAKSFEVRELQRGTHSIGFNYRIVGKRKDIKNHTRFAKIDPEIAVPRARSLRSARMLGRSSTSLRALPAILARPATARLPRSVRRRRRMPKGR